MTYHFFIHAAKVSICHSLGNLSQGVALGFVAARHFDPEQHYVQYDQRKTMARLLIASASELTQSRLETIRSLLVEAYLWDSRTAKTS
ncbi:MAG: hypothetical protein AAGF77_01680 [Bacteroidota bacterium]